MKQSIILLTVLLIFISSEGWTQSDKASDLLAKQYNPADRLATRDSLKAVRKEKDSGLSGNRKKADRLYHDFG